MRLSISAREQPRIAGRQPSLPQGVRIYAIGDIHGRLDLLDKLFSLIEADLVQRPVTRPIYVFLGDYIDRGKWSRETIDRLISHGAVHESIFLKGNHELIAVSCLSDRTKMDQWLRLGGRETLASYGVAPELFTKRALVAAAQSAFHHALPPAHFRFLGGLRNSFACGDFFFVHAGARPYIELSHQSESDLLWIRGEFLTSSHDFGKIIVHGHTPASEAEIRRNRINIDTGAFATGRLTCLMVEGEELAIIDTVMD
ncbi:MAG TPA: metallophosphoesterase family protein [Bryobacteraceae bacterium]|jgi:serine/threonine protein phosphatase 1|nr:metallophosphoesterase family protein [Bryobacteraceae bacterium]